MRHMLSGKFWRAVYAGPNWMYYMVPKVACTAIRDALPIDCNTPPVVDSMDVDQNSYRFGFVRDPFDRLASFYADKVCTDSTDNRKVRDHIGLTLEMKPAEFVDRLSQCYLTDHHTAPQSDILPDDLTFVGRFENIANDWPTVQKHVPTTADLIPLNQSDETTKNLFLDLPRYAVNRINDIYAKDFDVFGYERR